MKNNKFIWTPEYSVNIKEIDEQHKEFITITNSLIDLSENESTLEYDLLIKAEQLNNYALYHLSKEEELFEKYNYPRKEEHLKIHNAFREKALYFEEKIKASKKEKRKILTKEMAIFAGGWLLSHILIMDKEYTEFLNEKGLF